MKRALSLALIAGVLIAWTAQPGRAQSRRIGFFVNMGFMTKENVSPNWLTLGAELVLRLGAGWSINPEAALWGSNFGFNNYYIVPGALVNYRIGRFTFGAGVVKRFWVSRYGDDDSSEKIALKFQVGYHSMGSRIALVVIPLPAGEYVSYGLAFGLGF
jgi:hypothetical protein